MDSGQIVIILFLTLAFVASIALNILLLLYTKKTYRKTISVNVYIGSICISDTLSCCFGLVPHFIVMYDNRFVNSNNVFCVASGLITFIFCIVTIHLYGALALVQTISIMRPFFYRHHLVKFWTNIALVVVLFLYGTLLGTSPYFFGIGFAPDVDGKRCTIDWKHRNTKNFMLAFLPIGMLAPTIVVVTSVCVSQCHLGKQPNRSVLRRTKFYIKISIVTVVAFLVSWTPYSVVGFMISFGSFPNSRMFTVAALFAKFSTLCNPITYLIFSKPFRKYTRGSFTANGISRTDSSRTPSRETSATSMKGVVVMTNNLVRLESICEKC